METVKIEVPFIYVHYMDKVDKDGNNYRFFGNGKVWSGIDYFCSDEAGNFHWFSLCLAIKTSHKWEILQRCEPESMQMGKLDLWMPR